MDAQEVLGDVSQILSDREKDYHHYEDMLLLISEYWSTYLTSVLDESVEISGSEVATMMALFKIARSSVGGGEKTADDMKDALGYMAMSSAVRVWEAEGLVRGVSGRLGESVIGAVMSFVLRYER